MPNQNAPVLSEGQLKAVYDRWQSLSGGQKTAFYRANEAALNEYVNLLKNVQPTKGQQDTPSEG